MRKRNALTRLALIGGGPTALLLVRRLVDHFEGDLEIDVFEKEQTIGAGMPYSRLGAEDEHIANVSANELPDVLRPMEAWAVQQHPDTLARFAMDSDHFNSLKALPRLFLGSYLTAEFKLLEKACLEKGFSIRIHYGCAVLDMEDHPAKDRITVVHSAGRKEVDKAIICSGHYWPKTHEGRITGYFDSPYPPAKLRGWRNQPVAIRGASLTAIDAVRTLARENGQFYQSNDGKLHYQLAADASEFRMVMHSRNGLLPAVRIHLEDAHLGRGELLSPAEIERIKAEHEGFIPLDYLFEHVFLARIKAERPSFHQHLDELTMEAFVEKMMTFREDIEPFELLAREYREAARSIKDKKSIYWKEMLAVLSYTMNYPAKYFSAEDMLRLLRTLKPLISIVIAFVPQRSVEELLALHEAGILSLVNVGEESEVEPLETGGIQYHYHDHRGEAVSDFYPMFIDCIGQPTLSISDLPFESLKDRDTVVPAVVRFRRPEAGELAMAEGIKGVGKASDGHYYLQLPGLAINDHFQVTDIFGKINHRLYMLAVPFIGGFNPDYSGLDFSEEATLRVVKALTVDTQ